MAGNHGDLARAGRGPSADELPHALTFFLTAGERRAVLVALRKRGKNRAGALLRALGVRRGGGLKFQA